VSEDRPPDPAGAGVLRADANRTLLYITSLIPAGEWGFVPGELPCFSVSLPLPEWGVRQNAYNGARYGAGVLYDGEGVKTGCLRRWGVHIADSVPERDLALETLIPVLYSDGIFPIGFF